MLGLGQSQFGFHDGSFGCGSGLGEWLFIVVGMLDLYYPPVSALAVVACPLDSISAAIERPKILKALGWVAYYDHVLVRVHFNLLLVQGVVNSVVYSVVSITVARWIRTA